MNAGEWIALGGCVVTVLGGGIAWLLRLQGQLNSKISREEHERICSDRAERVERRLESIETVVTGTHRRIDDIYRDLLGQRGGR